MASLLFSSTFVRAGLLPTPRRNVEARAESRINTKVKLDEAKVCESSTYDFTRSQLQPAYRSPASCY